MSSGATFEIYHGDCRQFLAHMPDNHFQLILTDPPFNISSELVIHRASNLKYKGKDISHDFGEWDKFESEEQFWEFVDSWLSHLVRVLEPNRHMVIFFDFNRCGDLIRRAEKLGMKFRKPLYWIKSNPVPRARKVDCMRSIEVACWFTKGEVKQDYYNWQLGQTLDYVKCGIPHGKSRVHPTQKPVEFWERWVLYLSKPGEIVFDPFCGSGSSLVAALKHGRRAVGVDQEEEYVAHAAKWCLETVPQERLRLEEEQDD